MRKTLFKKFVDKVSNFEPNPKTVESAGRTVIGDAQATTETTKKIPKTFFLEKVHLML